MSPHKTPTITVQPRQRTGTRYARRLRTGGRLPAVIYGHKTAPVHISVDETEMLKLLQHGAHVMKLDIEGSGTETCLVKELQFGYLGDNIIHVDFTRVRLDEEVNVQVRLNFVGQPGAITKAGAILKHTMAELEVVCKVNEIPEGIIVDLTEMETHFTVADIKLPPGVRTEVDPQRVVAQISYVHREEPVGEEAEAIEVEGAEPEVITEARKEGEEEQGAEAAEEESES